MKNLMTIFGALLLAILPGYASDEIYTIGTYNIRILTSDDTGDKAWNSRKQNVANTIIDNGYDVVGMNEIVPGAQQRDIKSLLTGYSVVEWGSGSSTNPNMGRINMIAYKTSKFDLLDSGHYFMSTNPDKSYQSWDTSQKRLSVWAKLKNKNNGEIFYYFVTHLDHKGITARNEGARINVERMRMIAGNYPAFLVGDHNATTGWKAVYETIDAYMDDARVVAENPFTDTNDGTYCGWDPSKRGGRIDYVWSRNAKVLSYNVITDTYGKSITPSDHLPLIVTCKLEEYKPNHSFYVDPKLATNGDGSVANPFNDMQVAINAIGTGDTLHVATGTCTSWDSNSAALKISKSATVICGYSDDFKSIIGKTTFSGDILGNDYYDGKSIMGNEDNARHVVVIESGASLELRNCAIIGGNSLDNGGGILSQGSVINLINVDLSNNYANQNGAAIYTSGKILCDSCSFVNNIAGCVGGAFYTSEPQWWNYKFSNTLFEDNKAQEGAVGYIAGLIWGNFYSNTFVGNVSTDRGSIIFEGAKSASNVSFVNNTFTLNIVENAAGNNSGNAICSSMTNAASSLNLMNNTIVGNLTFADGNRIMGNTNGSVVYVAAGNLYLHNNIIAGNGGDINFSGTTSTSSYNVYTCKETINIESGESDIMETNYNASIASLASMMDAKVEDGSLIPTISKSDNAYIGTIQIIEPTYGRRAINILPTSQLKESITKADVDYDLETKSSLSSDQRGVERLTDGTATIGAYEYGSGSIVKPILRNSNSLKAWICNSSLYVMCEDAIAHAVLYNVSGISIVDNIALKSGINIIDIGDNDNEMYILSTSIGNYKVMK